MWVSQATVVVLLLLAAVACAPNRESPQPQDGHPGDSDARTADAPGLGRVDGDVTSVVAGNGQGYIAVQLEDGRVVIYRQDADDEPTKIAELPGLTRAETTVDGSLLAIAWRCPNEDYDYNPEACPRTVAEAYLVSPDGSTERTELFTRTGPIGPTDSLSVESVTPEQAWVFAKGRQWPVTADGVGGSRPDRFGEPCGIDGELYVTRVPPEGVLVPPFSDAFRGIQILRTTGTGAQPVEGGTLAPYSFGARNVLCDANSFTAVGAGSTEVARWTPAKGWGSLSGDVSRPGDPGDLATAEITTSTSQRYLFDRSSGELRRATAGADTEPVVSFSVPRWSPDELPTGGLWADDAGADTLIACLQAGVESGVTCEVVEQR